MGRVIWPAVTAAALGLIVWALAFGIPAALSADVTSPRRTVTVVRVVQARVDGKPVGWWAARARRNGARMRTLQASLRRHVQVDQQHWLARAFLCIQSYETAPPYPGWQTASGNGYFGGVQMDLAFQRRYGDVFLQAWGTADRWPPFVQVAVAIRAYLSGRGFRPWPNTARKCGLL